MGDQNTGAGEPHHKRVWAAVVTAFIAVIAALGTAASGYAPHVVEERLEGWGLVQAEESIGGRVLQNEEPLIGVTVILLEADTSITVSSRTTDSDGFYMFGNVQEGDYIVIARRGEQTLGSSSILVRDGDVDKEVRTINVGGEEVVVAEPAVMNATQPPQGPPTNPALVLEQPVTQQPLPDQQLTLRYESVANPLLSSQWGLTYYTFTVWIEGASIDAGEVYSATYYLPYDFQPPIVTVFPETSGSNLTLELFYTGNFPIHAQVFLADGSWVELEAFITI